LRLSLWFPVPDLALLRRKPLFFRPAPAARRVPDGLRADGLRKVYGFGKNKRYFFGGISSVWAKKRPAAKGFLTAGLNCRGILGGWVAISILETTTGA